MQVVSRQGNPPAPVRGGGGDISGTAGSQVRTTHKKDLVRFITEIATSDCSSDIPLYNRFAVLDVLEEPGFDLDHVLDNDANIGITLGVHPPVLAKLYLLRKVNTWDDFDKNILKKKVDVDTIRQARSCNDYIASTKQMGKPFTLSPLTTYVGVPTKNDCLIDSLLAHLLVRSSGCQNFLGVRIPVQLKLDISCWRDYLHTYWDQQLVDLLEFGFTLDFDRNLDLTSTEDNHSSAISLGNMVMHILMKNCCMVLCLAPLIISSLICISLLL